MNGDLRVPSPVTSQAVIPVIASMMISIACSHMGLMPAEAIAAATYNAAFAVCRHDEVGSLEAGKRADFLVLDCENYREIPYRFGINPVRRVFVGGREWV